MFRAPTLLAPALAGLALAASAGAQAPPTVAHDRPGSAPTRLLASGRRIVASELLVGVAPDTGLPEAARALGVEVIGSVPHRGVLRVALPDGADEVVMRARVAALPGVECATLHDVGEVAGAPAPDDTFFASQWHLENTGQNGGSPGADIDLLGAWNIRTGSASVHVAVIDSGVDLAHPELAGRLLPGFDFVDEDSDPTEVYPHGTQVTGLLAASSNDAFGTAGVDPSCGVIPLRVIGATGTVQLFDLIQALDHVATTTARIAVMSLQGLFPNPLLDAALEDADAAGVILFSAAGNGGQQFADGQYPSASAVTITIGMTTKTDWRAFFSGTGAAVDFVAPGDGVVTVAYSTANTFSTFSGTSAATPIAAGIASLLLSQNPTLDRAAIYALLVAGAEDLVGVPWEDTPGWDTFHGHGRLDAAKSLAALCGCTAAEPLTASPPTVSPASGGTVAFQLDAGAASAGQVYWLLGSATGTEPGLELDGGVVLPLVYDPYFRLTLKVATALFTDSLGLLDADGRGTALLSVPALGDPSLEGLVLHHAFAVFDVQPLAQLASNAHATTLASPAVQVVFSEDFEAGLGVWTVANGFGGLWRLAAAGECGAPSAMAAYNRPPTSCDYDASLLNQGTLASPLFALAGVPPYTLELLTIRGVSASGLDTTTIRVVDAAGVLPPHVVDAPALAATNDGAPTALSLPLGLSSKWIGRTVSLEFAFAADGIDNAYTGWMIDDLSVVSRVE